MRKITLSLTLLLSFLFTSAAMAKVVRVEVRKSNRVMELIDHKGEVIRTYDVMLGQSPIGPKVQRGDNKTPEGKYKINWRNPKSSYFLSLHISYPNKEDRQNSRDLGVDPGDNIFIHGLPNKIQRLSSFERRIAESILLSTDWTNGCIAVSNKDMQEIWDLVPNGADIEILP
ncbi:L,D-transpeptidase family protein [Halobacteriovorax marinus]|uniref:L,D-transpeptidase family protein n=1 Tax=Halobacteriovorax marinus TaxID=97084 RepID=UPI003A94D124